MKTYSQIGQDRFVLDILQQKKNGLFLDIGGAWPVYLNNTYALEKDYGWTGVSMDLESTYAKDWEQSDRTSDFLVQDALTADYHKIINDLLTHNKAERVDYLSVDLEPPFITLEALRKIPFDTYRFSVITFETDMYRDDPGHNFDTQYTMRESRELLTKHGYKLVFVNMQEDWWVDGGIFESESYIDINQIPQDIKY
jgi:hypothetical protein